VAQNLSDEAWARFDALVGEAARSNPWDMHTGSLRFRPDYELLSRLLAVPIRLGAGTQSGIPAKAVDVWVAHELRRAGFDADEVWPRATEPRILPREVAMLRDAPGVTQRVAAPLFDRIDSGHVRGGVTAANANVLGKAYVKQVDVVIAQWARGPELLVSTKRMDSSFGKNALNRIEESYGDAKNLRGRHPLAAIGFLFVMRSTAFDKERDTALRLMDLLAKLAQEPDAYDATAAIVTEWSDPSGASLTEQLESKPLDVTVSLRHDLVPPELRPDDFLRVVIEAMLARTPVDLHVQARRMRGEAAPQQEATTGATDEGEENEGASAQA
jgi:hypothetical protein